MPFGTKNCKYCAKLIELKTRRDIDRRKFCSYSCRQKFRFANGEWDMKRMWEKCNTPEANLKKVHKGDKHPLWIKDRSKVKVQRTIAEMRWWRKKVFERDNYTCQFCGRRGYKLNADHIKPYVLYPELREDINNGRTLCIDCHKQTPTYARNAKHYVTICK